MKELEFISEEGQGVNNPMGYDQERLNHLRKFAPRRIAEVLKMQSHIFARSDNSLLYIFQEAKDEYDSFKPIQTNSKL